jgi:hypothetical protein
MVRNDRNLTRSTDMTDLLRRALRRLDAATAAAFHSAFAPLGRRYLDVARRP